MPKKADSGTKTKYSGRTMQSGIGVVADRRSPLAPFPWQQVTPAQVGFTVSPPGVGALIRKGSSKTGEPAGGKNAHRVQNYERHGAQHRVVIPMRGGMPTATASGVNYPPAAATQANGRIIASYPKAQDLWSGRDFWEQASYKG